MEKIKKYLTEEAFVLFLNIVLFGFLSFVLLYFVFTVFVLKADVLEEYKIKANEYVPVPAVISNMGILNYSEFIYLKNNSSSLSEDEMNNLVAEKIILKNYLGDDYIDYVQAKKGKIKLYILAD